MDGDGIAEIKKRSVAAVYNIFEVVSERGGWGGTEGERNL